MIPQIQYHLMPSILRGSYLKEAKHEMRLLDRGIVPYGP